MSLLNSPLLVTKIKKNMTGLFKVKDPCTLGGGSDTVFGTTVDLGKLNSQFEVVFLL